MLGSARSIPVSLAVVCGGRYYRNMLAVAGLLDWAHEKRLFTEIAQGGATGADSLAQRWACRRNVPCRTLTADWGRHPRAAGIRRNRALLDLQPCLVIAFPGGAGTAHMVAIAEAAGVRVLRYREHAGA